MSGVIQGSVLGPILALMMLDSIDDKLTYCAVSKYADDNKLYAVVKDTADQQAVQNDLDRVSQWAKRWGFELNVDKCSIIQFGGGTPWSFSLNG